MASPNLYQQLQKQTSKKKVTQAITRIRATGLTEAAEELQAHTEKLKSQVRPKTLENYANHLSKIIRTINKNPNSFNNDDIRAYFNSIQDKSNGTKYAVYQSLRSYFCDYKKYDRMMNKDLTSKWEELMANIKRPVQSKRLMSDDDLIKPEELEALIKGCRDDRDKAFFSMLFETGARIGELISLEMKDVRLESTPVKVYIRHSKTEDKEGRRVVHIIKSVPYLKRWLDQHPLNKDPSFFSSNNPLWVSLDKNQRVITIYGWSQALNRAAKRAGITKHLFHHLFRHSRAYDLHYNYDFDIKEVKEVLGHSKLETTDGYLKINKDLMIQKLTGGVHDVEESMRREEAIKAGRPVLCACGIENEPKRAFCVSCGRVVNQEVAKELYANKDKEKQELEERMRRMEGMLKVIADNSNLSDLKKAVKIK